MASKPHLWTLDTLNTFWLDFEGVIGELNGIVHNNQQSHIPYDIVKTDDGIRIDLAVAGFERSDLKVVYKEGSQHLEVTGSKKDPDKKVQFIVKKIANRAFSYKWRIDRAQYTVGPVTLNNGILTIVIQRSNVDQPDTVKTFNIQG